MLLCFLSVSVCKPADALSVFYVGFLFIFFLFYAVDFPCADDSPMSAFLIFYALSYWRVFLNSYISIFPVIFLSWLQISQLSSINVPVLLIPAGVVGSLFFLVVFAD